MVISNKLFAFFSLTILSLSSIATIANAGDLLANINYGETRDIVTNKLTKSKAVKATVPESMIARVGLNGSFSTTRELAGLKFALYFDWNDSSGLKEITYRSDALPNSSYDQRLKSTWDYAINLISAIYGKASNAGEYPKRSEITKGSIQFSHEWKTRNGYIYLGIGQETKDYSLNITFSKVSLNTEK